MEIRKGIVYAALLGMGLTVCCQGNGQTQTHQPELDLTVWVENWAGAPLVVLASANGAAGKVFLKAGVKVHWRAVSAGERAPRSWPGASLILRILESKDAGFPEPSLGFRWQRGPDDARAIVFIDRIEQFARRSNVRSETAAILGCAMVHELGHLLLGPTHSGEGVMRAEWNKADAWAATQGNLGFTQEQAKFIREEVLKRLRTEADPVH